MRRKACSLVGLEHSVGEGVLLGHLEVGRHVRGFYIRELTVCGTVLVLAAALRNKVRSVHLAAVVHELERMMPVIDVITIVQPHRRKRNALALRVYTDASDVRAVRN